LSCRQQIRRISWNEIIRFRRLFQGKMSFLEETKFSQETCQSSRLSRAPEEEYYFKVHSGRRRSRLFTGNVWRRRTKEGRRERENERGRRGMREGEKNSPLVPGISVAYRWHENVAFGFFLQSPQRERKVFQFTSPPPYSLVGHL
jgi:hypothetical protein